MKLWHAEWTRLRRNRVSVCCTVSVLMLLLASALDAGLGAARYREHLQVRQQQWSERIDALTNDAGIVDPAEASGAVASAVFEFGRTEAPAALRPPLGGLALAVRHFTAVPADLRVTLESRYIDSRRTESITNPLLFSFVLPDFAVAVALLLPLMVIALTYGVVQEGRELGAWILVRAQTARPWRPVFVALCLRWLVAIIVVAVPTTLAFALDPGAEIRACLLWMAGVGMCATVWVAIAGLCNLLRLSSAATALALLGVWLITTVAVPALIVSFVREQVPAPSELATLRHVRDVQQRVETDEQPLLQRWYESNPKHVPVNVTSHAFPVTFVPRYLEQDRHIVPMMRRFEELRGQRADLIAPWLAFAPGAALVLLGDQLSGSSPQHQNRYAEAVLRLEQRWRAVLIPGVMSYGGLTRQDTDALRALRLDMPVRWNAAPLLAALLLAATVLPSLLLLLRHRLAQ